MPKRSSESGVVRAPCINENGHCQWGVHHRPFHHCTIGFICRQCAGVALAVNICCDRESRSRCASGCRRTGPPNHKFYRLGRVRDQSSHGLQRSVHDYKKRNGD